MAKIATHPSPSKAKRPPRDPRLDKELREAAARNMPHLFEELLARGASADARFQGDGPLRGLTVGMLCAQIYAKGFRSFDDHPGHRLVLERCDPRQVDGGGMTALMHAAAERNLRALEILAPRSKLSRQVAKAPGRKHFVGWNALCFAVNANLGFHGADPSMAAQSEMARIVEALADKDSLAAATEEDGGVDDINARFGAKPLVAAELARQRRRCESQEQAGQIAEAIPEAKPSKRPTPL